MLNNAMKNAGSQSRSFEFDRDTFAFANELAWEYRLDLQTGKMTSVFNQPVPEYIHRCFVLVRSARQFFYHARFDPAQPALESQQYRPLIREVVSRNPRHFSEESRRVVIPGYAGLRAFSQAQAAVLKANCGGAWQSYFLRSHWRMVLPVWRQHQENMARHLLKVFPLRVAPIAHIVRFPQLTINHGIVLFGFRETAETIQFQAYDPNIPAQPTELVYNRAQRTFFFPRNHYWAGGRVDVVEVYRGWFY